MARKITIEELRELASNARESIWEQAYTRGREPKIYLHWTAGSYTRLYLDEYHINITGDGTVWIEADLDEILSHTYMRNTGAIGVALCCCAGGGSSWLGEYPPTDAQIQAMAQVIVALCDGLWLTIDKGHVLTHGEAANNEDGIYPHPAYAWWNDEEGDGNTRGDLEYLGTNESPEYNPYAQDGSRGGDVLRGKANYYRSRWSEE